MRCEICNNPLTQAEDRRVHGTTGERIGLCDDCLNPILDIQYIPLEQLDGLPVELEATEELSGILDQFPRDYSDEE